jgi:CNT family concentrative nucleoside transporter
MAMAGRTSVEAAPKPDPYYDLSAEQNSDTTKPTHHTENMIQPEPHGPDHIYYKEAGSGVDKGGSKTDNIMVDVEKGGVSPASEPSSREESEEPTTRSGIFWRKSRPAFHLAIWLLFTAWWIVGLVKHRPGTAKPKNWVVPFLLWLAITIRIVTLYIPISVVYKPVKLVWRHTVSRGVSMIPEKFRLPLGGAGTVIVICLGAFVSETHGDNNRENRAISLLGLALLIIGMYATSRNRKAINCKHYMRPVNLSIDADTMLKGTRLSWEW